VRLPVLAGYLPFVRHVNDLMLLPMPLPGKVNRRVEHSYVAGGPFNNKTGL
jgi:hypothetical protein